MCMIVNKLPNGTSQMHFRFKNNFNKSFGLGKKGSNLKAKQRSLK